MKLKTPVTVAEAAQLLGISYKGNPQQLIEGINEIHKVEKGDLTFVDVKKYYDKALKSAATIILINQEVELPEGKSILISDDPFRDYNKLVKRFMNTEVPNTMPAIPDDAVIYPGVYIGSDVKLGKNCVIYPNVTIYDNCIIGDNVIIHANTVIGGHAFYYKNRQTHHDKMISCGRVIIENDVEIGASCTIDKGVSGDTIIGEGTKLDNQVHLGHGVVVGKRCLIGAQVGVGGKTIIEDEVIIWGQAGITKDIRIGAKAVISAQSGVSKSLEGDKAYFGTPAREIRQVYKEMAWLRRKMEEEGN